MEEELPQSLKELSSLLYEQGAYREAIERISDLLREFSDDGRLYSLMGIAYFFLDQEEEAIHYLCRGVEKAPTFEAGSVALVAALLNAARYYDALEEIIRFLKSSSSQRYAIEVLDTLLDYSDVPAGSTQTSGKEWTRATGIRQRTKRLTWLLSFARRLRTKSPEPDARWYW
jgi:tetratricopeptide (TPR) repeat protein